MDKEAICSIIAERLNSAKESLDSHGDLDEYIQNIADGGNHDDTFSAGQDFGFLEGKIQAYKGILAFLSYSN